MSWFDIVKKVKVDGNIIKEIFQEIITRDKRVIVNTDTAFEILNKYSDILTERARNELYSDKGKKITREKIALMVKFKRNTTSFRQIIQGYIRNLYPQLKTSQGLIYFINENETDKYLSEHPLRMKESYRRRRDREGR